MNLQIQLLKSTLDKYNTNSSFSNYDSIAKKYQKIYSALTKDKKSNKGNNDNFIWHFANDNQSSLYNDKLKEEVMKWFMSLSLEDRLKVVTVENEWYCKIIYHMHNFNEAHNESKFKAKETSFNPEHKEELNLSTNCSQSKTSSCLEGDEIIYPANKVNLNSIKLHKVSKNKSETVVYTQENLDDLSNDDLLEMNIGNFFYFISDKELNMQFNRTDDMLNEIKFYSVHHKDNFPDCMTLSPSILLKEAYLENYFKMSCENQLYFKNLIKPYSSPVSKHCSYMLPDWMTCDTYYRMFQYIFGFFEQAILIKFLLNYSIGKKSKNQPVISSLINQAALDSFFENRNNAINYINVNYSIEIRDDLLNKAIDIEGIYSQIEKDETKNKYIKLMKAAVKTKGYSLFKDRVITNRKTKISTPGEMKEHVLSLYENHGNIEFVDKLAYHNIKALCESSMFAKEKIFNQLVKLHYDKNIEDLLLQDDNAHPNKKKRKKGKSNIQKEDAKVNNTNNVNKNSKQNDKETEEELYLPYYLKRNNELRVSNAKNNSMGNNNNINNISIKKKKVNEGQLIQKENAVCIGNHEVDQIVDFFNNSYPITTERQKHKEDLFNNLYNDDNNDDDNNNTNSNEKKAKVIDDDNNNKQYKNNNYNSNNSNKTKEIITTGIFYSNTASPEKNKKDTQEKPQPKVDEIQSTPKDKTDTQLPKEEILQTQTQSKEEKDIKNAESSETITNDSRLMNTKEKFDKDTQDEIKSEPTSETEPNNEIDSNSPYQSRKEKKKKKYPFFLYDPNKKKKPKKQKILKNSMIPPEFHLYSSSRKQNPKKTFFEKLHNDLLHFDSSISEILILTKNIKDYCINYTENIITASFNEPNINYEKDIYGSFATGLMIETSDVDIKIRLNTFLPKDEFEKVFFQLVKEFDKENKYESISPISTASVPVIKLLFDPELFIQDNEQLSEEWKDFKESIQYKTFKFDYEEITKFKIDITFLLHLDCEIQQDKRIYSNSNANISSVTYAKEKITQFPQLKILIRLLKRYFHIKKLNNAFTGMDDTINILIIII